MKNVSSGDRRPFFLTPDGGILPHAGCGIWRIRKGDGKMLPILAGLVKRLVIQCEPGMAVEIRQFFSYPTMKNYRIPIVERTNSETTTVESNFLLCYRERVEANDLHSKPDHPSLPHQALPPLSEGSIGPALEANS